MKKFKSEIRALVVPHTKLKGVIKDAPKRFGEEPKKYRYDVVFLKKPLTPAKALAAFEVKDGVDSVYRGTHTIYFTRLTAKATQSRLSTIVFRPEYQHMTIRNWNTTTKLLALMDVNR